MAAESLITSTLESPELAKAKRLKEQYRPLARDILAAMMDDLDEVDGPQHYRNLLTGDDREKIDAAKDHVGTELQKLLEDVNCAETFIRLGADGAEIRNEALIELRDLLHANPPPQRLLQYLISIDQSLKAEIHDTKQTIKHVRSALHDVLREKLSVLPEPVDQPPKADVGEPKQTSTEVRPAADGALPKESDISPKPTANELIAKLLGALNAIRTPLHAEAEIHAFTGETIPFEADNLSDLLEQQLDFIRTLEKQWREHEGSAYQHHVTTSPTTPRPFIRSPLYVALSHIVLFLRQHKTSLSPDIILNINRALKTHFGKNEFKGFRQLCEQCSSWLEVEEFAQALMGEETYRTVYKPMLNLWDNYLKCVLSTEDVWKRDFESNGIPNPWCAQDTSHFSMFTSYALAGVDATLFSVNSESWTHQKIAELKSHRRYSYYKTYVQKVEERLPVFNEELKNISQRLDDLKKSPTFLSLDPHTKKFICHYLLELKETYAHRRDGYVLLHDPMNTYETDTYAVAHHALNELGQLPIQVSMQASSYDYDKEDEPMVSPVFMIGGDPNNILTLRITLPPHLRGPEFPCRIIPAYTDIDNTGSSTDTRSMMGRRIDFDKVAGKVAEETAFANVLFTQTHLKPPAKKMGDRSRTPSTVTVEICADLKDIGRPVGESLEITSNDLWPNGLKTYCDTFEAVCFVIVVMDASGKVVTVNTRHTIFYADISAFTVYDMYGPDKNISRSALAGVNQALESINSFNACTARLSDLKQAQEKARDKTLFAPEIARLSEHQQQLANELAPAVKTLQAPSYLPKDREIITTRFYLSLAQAAIEEKSAVTEIVTLAYGAIYHLVNLLALPKTLDNPSRQLIKAIETLRAITAHVAQVDQGLAKNLCRFFNTQLNKNNLATAIGEKKPIAALLAEVLDGEPTEEHHDHAFFITVEILKYEYQHLEKPCALANMCELLFSSRKPRNDAGAGHVTWLEYFQYHNNDYEILYAQCLIFLRHRIWKSNTNKFLTYTSVEKFIQENLWGTLKLYSVAQLEGMDRILCDRGCTSASSLLRSYIAQRNRQFVMTDQLLSIEDPMEGFFAIFEELEHNYYLPKDHPEKFTKDILDQLKQAGKNKLLELVRLYQGDEELLLRNLHSLKTRMAKFNGFALTVANRLKPNDDAYAEEREIRQIATQLQTLGTIEEVEKLSALLVANIMVRAPHHEDIFGESIDIPSFKMISQLERLRLDSTTPEDGAYLHAQLTSIEAGLSELNICDIRPLPQELLKSRAIKDLMSLYYYFLSNTDKYPKISQMLQACIQQKERSSLEGLAGLSATLGALSSPQPAERKEGRLLSEP